MARFLCPNCQKGFKWHKGIAGKHVHCTACGKEMVVPAEGNEPTRGVSINQSKSDNSRSKTKKVARPSWESQERTVTATAASQPANQWWKLVGTSAGTAVLVIIFVVAKGIGRSARYSGSDLAQTVASKPVEIPQEAARMFENQMADAPPETSAGNRRAPGQQDGTARSAEGLNQESVLQPASVPPPLAPPDPPLAIELPTPKEPAPTVVDQQPVPQVPRPGYRPLAPGETPFELFDAQFVQHGLNDRFNQFGFPPDASLSLRYRIKPIDQVFNIYLYRVAIKIQGQTHPIAFEKLSREGMVQAGFRSFGIDRGIQGSVEAWVEKINPNNPSDLVRVSNVVTFAPSNKLPEEGPPPVENPNIPPLQVDTEMPVAMKAAAEKREKERAERERPLGEQEIASALKEIKKAPNEFKVREILQKLAKTPAVASHQEEVDATLAKLFKTGDDFTKTEVVKTWRKWPSDKAVECWMKALSLDNHFAISEAIGGLAESERPEAIPPLVKHAKTGEHRGEIEKALISFGDQAEGEVVKLLDSDDKDNIKLGLKVLEKIGTQKSTLSKVLEMTKHRDTFVRMDADRTYKSLSARVE
jgi:hypothetical protein